ncbi:hypothetical protein EJ994_05070 [Maribacter sp. MJ134]|uniref:hypothetical protein n=1 Tax=Maribacter sp. MJ134 TaxID=2496865 RepID=UPI000F83FB40|nr:hypothetical protein [Maribacter sp. MJ134]AZQ58212.1 hypothetical protein EJ994_05070 [Maribacter sp. MJ134]
MESIVKKKLVKKKIFIESLVVLCIAISPFLYKLYEYLPVNADGSVSLLWFEISNNGFEDASFYIWFLTSKIVPLYLLVVWFLTSRDWWYHIIIIPIAMYAFQLFEVIFDSDNHIDTENIFWLLPICMVVIPLVYFFRLKLYDKYVHGIDLEAMDAELQELKEKPELKNSSVEKPESKASEELLNESIAEEIDRKLSTTNIENALKQLQHRLQNWLHLKF